ncbi:Acetyltransferase (GNAT) domain-containing protein [Thermoanaerobacterium sp. RBIITD]|nr:Acetyltransferase (GNAT) domain-containing protein [Thermoanaerobacterium sp. RBIITD]
MLNDMEVASGLILASKLITPAKEREIIQKLSNELIFATIDLSNNCLIRNIWLNSADHINGIAELGIFIGNKDYWNKGYGSEAIKLLLDFAFNILNLYNVYLKTYYIILKI